jgi:outer membrane receptor for ferrienterochelin and colicins
MKRARLTFIFCFILHALFGQTEGTAPVRPLDLFVVTASRTLRKQDSLPIPVTLITKKDIQRLGSRRLIDVLREQTGLVFTTDEHGSGLQMQGLDPDYTMILVDGQPLIGRLTGKLDLSRVTVGNIERIEIIKGASSSLYGSEALAGVINIITSGAGAATKAELSARGGSYGTADITANGNYAFANGKGGLQMLANYYRTDGYSLDAGQSGQALPPFYSYTVQGKLKYVLNQRSSLQLSGRYAYRYQHTVYNFSGSDPTRDATAEHDANIIGSWYYTFSSRWKSRLEYYLSLYNTDEKITLLNTGKENDTSFFRQALHRLEWQHDYTISRQLLFTGGIGGNLESVKATRYPGRESMQSGYIYLQQQYNPGKRWNIIGGLRGDWHSVYGSLISPKLAIQYNPHPKLSVRASLGRGFKAPDFRQLYLSFTNPLVGYTVLGTEEVKKGALRQMQEAGEITTVYPAAYQASADLKAERSWSYNAGAVYKPLSSLRLELNAFYNNVSNLIQSVPIAGKTNGWFVYSYVNVSKVYTEGLETSGRWQLSRNLDWQWGYQLLYAKDRDIIDSIKTGTGSYGTIADPHTGVARRATPKDYFGLAQRSRHQLNTKIYYHFSAWGLTAGARANYSGKAGFADQNGNGYIDRYDQFAPAYCLLSFSLEKSLLKERLAIQLSVENATNYTNALIAGQAGRQLFAGLRWNWDKRTINQSSIKEQ